MDIVSQLGIPIIILYVAIGYAARNGVDFGTIRIVFDMIEHVLRIFALLQLSTLFMVIINILDSNSQNIAVIVNRVSLSETLTNYTMN